MTYRMADRKSLKNDFNIERFAYDVFAYMLRICGLPENKIPTSDLKENTYIENDFVMNVGLSALPIALFKRDELRTMFETLITERKMLLYLQMRCTLESLFLNNAEEECDNIQSKIQFSLALYIEFILYQNSKNPDSSFRNLPLLWIDTCKKLLTENEDPDLTFESSLTMCPGISESWITNFIREFAIPYGNINKVSKMFSAYVLEGNPETVNPCDEISASGANKQEEILSQPSNVSDEHSKRFHTENRDSGLKCMSGRFERSSGQTSDLDFFQTSSISDECPSTLFPENIDSGSKHLPERWDGSSGQLQTSKEYVPTPSTPEDSINILEENTNSENNSGQRIWERFVGKLQSSTKSDPQSSGTSDELSSEIFHRSTDAGVNYIPGRCDESSMLLQTDNESSPQPPGTSDEYSVKCFQGNTYLESNVIPDRSNLPRSSDQQPISEKSCRIETKAYGRNINGLTYVLKQCLKKRKRNSSEKIDVDDSFEKMNIDEGNVSPESLDTKRRKMYDDTAD